MGRYIITFLLQKGRLQNQSRLFGFFRLSDFSALVCNILLCEMSEKIINFNVKIMGVVDFISVWVLANAQTNAYLIGFDDSF